MVRELFNIIALKYLRDNGNLVEFAEKPTLLVGR